MEVFSALGAPGNGKQGNRGTEKNEPDGKHSTRTAVGLRHLKRQPR
jgi:hypothetical protein